MLRPDDSPLPPGEPVDAPPPACSAPRDAPEPAPVADRERIESIDVLRGVAVLGILILNIQSFAMIGAAYMNPHAYGDLSGANYWVWYLSQVFAEQKFMTIFSMLFGAGIVIMTSRAEVRTGRSAAVHYRRMAWLILFGLLHAHLLWYGDILYAYGLCGLLVWPMRRWPPTVLIPLGLLVVAIGSAISFANGLFMESSAGAQAAGEFLNGWLPAPELVQAELDAYRGSWLEQMSSRVPTAVFFETFLFLVWSLWRAGGLMLVGMGLFKLGVFSAQRSRGAYLTMAATGLGLGVPLAMYGLHWIDQRDWDGAGAFFFGGQFNYWASLLISMAYVSLVMLACTSATLRHGVLRPFAAVGRIALTNYLIQTLMCTTIFYGHGLAYFGHVERTGQISIVAGVWAFQLIFSTIWLRYFAFGPFEWLWRSLTYWRLQPMRRGGAIEPAGA